MQEEGGGAGWEEGSPGAATGEMVEEWLLEGGDRRVGCGGEALLVGVGKVVDALLNPCTITTHMLLQDTLTKEEAENQKKTLELRNLQVNLWTMKMRKD